VADATPGAGLFVGLRRGITRAEFERRIGEGTVAGCFHRIRVKRGDAMFLPSGRVHALGAGNVILEIQQNSDTTYRVFDWNRLGLDGKPRELHVKESLACIDFDDFEPGLVPAGRPDLPIRVLVDHPLFNIQWRRLTAGESAHTDGHRLQILAGLDGELEIAHGPEHVALRPGQFCLVPACLPQVPLRTGATTAWLHVWAGKAE
jgi:mannose-6-phosphate isomerase